MKRLQLRKIHTCFGEFVIESNLLSGECIARSVMDNEFYYNLPPNMTNDEIKDYFRLLKEMEE